MALPAAGRGVLGAPFPSRSFTPGRSGARAGGLRALRPRKPGEVDRSARSQLLRGPAGAGHAQCGRRAAVRQLGSSRSRAVGARTPAALPAAPRQWQTSRRPRSSLGRHWYPTNKITQPPLPLYPNPSNGGCGRGSAAAGPCPLAGDQQVNCWAGGGGGRGSASGEGGGLEETEMPAGWLAPLALAAHPPQPRPQPLEGQQRVKSAPRHPELGPPPAAATASCAARRLPGAADAPPEPRGRLGSIRRLLPSRSSACPVPSRPLGPAGLRPGGGGVRRAVAAKDPCLRGKRGGGGPLRFFRLGPQGHPSLGLALGPPTQAPRKVFPPPVPFPHPLSSSGWGGFGSIGEKSHTFPSAAPPPGDRGWGGLEASPVKDPGGPPAPPPPPPPPQERCVLGLRSSRVPAEGCPHQCVSACLAAAASNLLYSFLQRHSERAGEEGERGSLSAKCCSLVLRGGCSSSNSHSFCRLT